jgi:hypothetical protein
VHYFSCPEHYEFAPRWERRLSPLHSLALRLNTLSVTDCASRDAFPPGTDPTALTNPALTGAAAADAVSAEDALNAHRKKMELRSEVFNKARTAHMKEFQARFTKEQQVLFVCALACVSADVLFFVVVATWCCASKLRVATVAVCVCA